MGTLYVNSNVLFFITSCSFLFRMRNVSDKSYRENKNTHFRFNYFIFFFFFENRAIYGIMWKNIVDPDRPQMTIWHMHPYMLDN